MSKFEKLLFIVRNGDKLSDEHMSAASELLQAQFAHVQGCALLCWDRNCAFHYLTR